MFLTKYRKCASIGTSVGDPEPRAGIRAFLEGTRARAGAGPFLDGAEAKIKGALS